MVSFSTTIEMIVDVPFEQAFLRVVPIDLSSIFTGFGPLPAVSGVTGQVGDWNAAGQTRSVIFSELKPMSPNIYMDTEVKRKKAFIESEY